MAGVYRLILEKKVNDHLINFIAQVSYHTDWCTPVLKCCVIFSPGETVNCRHQCKNCTPCEIFITSEILLFDKIHFSHGASTIFEWRELSSKRLPRSKLICRCPSVRTVLPHICTFGSTLDYTCLQFHERDFPCEHNQTDLDTMKCTKVPLQIMEVRHLKLWFSFIDFPGT